MTATAEALEQCRFLAAAYPILDAGDTCTEHPHDEPTFALARAFAVMFQDTLEPSDEQVGWFMDDAGAVVTDFDPAPSEWAIEQQPTPARRSDAYLSGIDQWFKVNGVEYVLQESEWEPSRPVKLATYLEWIGEGEE
jgi:hypothetical protein